MTRPRPITEMRGSTTAAYSPDGPALVKQRARLLPLAAMSREAPVRTQLSRSTRLAADGLAGGAAGMLVALVEFTAAGLWSAFGGAAIPLYLLFTHVLAGALLGACCGVVREAGAALRLGQRFTRLRSRTIVLVLGPVSVLTGAAAAWFVYAKGIEVSALPWHLLLPACVFGLGWGVASWLLRRLRDARLVWLPLLVLVAGAPIGGLAGSFQAAPRDESVAAALDHGATSRWAISLARSLADGDGDGFPTAFCSRECDCRDDDPAVNPAATEEMDNGVDEDCDGADMTRAEALALAGFTPPPEPVEPPPPPAPEEPLAEEEVVEPPPPVDAPPAWKGRHNVILVVMDAVRADHTTLCGYERDTSPRLADFATRAVNFVQARSTGPMTREALPGILAGQYYGELHRLDRQWPKFFDQNQMVAESFRAAGYFTFGIVSFIYVLPEYGFAQGFEEFDSEILKLRDNVHWKRTSDLVTDRTLARIDAFEEAGDERPFFVFAHYADPHAGYKRHEEAPRFGGYTADKYDEEIYFTDLHIGRLLDGLAERKLMDSTIVVVTSDHGEGLRKSEDHGHLYHGQTVYDNLIHVPLVIHAPGLLKPREFTTPVSTVDIVPTLVELTGVEHPALLSGVSLVPYLHGRDEPAHPPVFAQKALPRARQKIAMVDWPHKVVWNLAYNRWELYHLASDPNERQDLARRERELLGKLQTRVKAWRSAVLREIPGRRED